jgi:ribosomal protein S18 acetylase RimI-like enzyme
MVDWLEEEARRRGLAVARTSALAADERAVRLLAAHGFSPIRHFYRMVIDLDGPPPEPDWPAGFEVSTFRPGEDEEVLHAVTEESFAEHWGHEDRDLDAWQRTVFETPWWDPSLVYLVRAGDEVVAAEVNAVRFGAGWVGTIGTLKPWRGRGLGRALLLTAFGEFYRRGERRVRLAVDAGNETGATQLYEGVGMRIAWQADVYEKHL